MQENRIVHDCEDQTDKCVTQDQILSSFEKYHDAIQCCFFYTTLTVMIDSYTANQYLYQLL